MTFKVLALWIVASTAFLTANTVKADEAKVMQAKVALGEAFTKMALLTNSFTEKGKQESGAAGMQLAHQFSVKIDEMVSNGLQHDGSCEQITQYSDQRINEMFEQTKDDKVNSAAALRSVANTKSAIHNYVVAQCENLNG